MPQPMQVRRVSDIERMLLARNTSHATRDSAHRTPPTSAPGNATIELKTQAKQGSFKLCANHVNQP